MKIEATVIGVEDCGESIQIQAQGREIGAADWRGLDRQAFKISMSDRNAKAFYIGRKLEIEIKPK